MSNYLKGTEIPLEKLVSDVFMLSDEAPTMEHQPVSVKPVINYKLKPGATDKADPASWERDQQGNPIVKSTGYRVHFTISKVSTWVPTSAAEAAGAAIRVDVEGQKYLAWCASKCGWQAKTSESRARLIV